MKGVVFTCDGGMYVKSFGQPLYKTIGCGVTIQDREEIEFDYGAEVE